ncbi:MAG: type II toxin-antitoxin system HicA family toxin [Alistipes sp.]|nr:type II toxin-antitoxin system HicA family toxin [Alistipes sp.]
MPMTPKEMIKHLKKNGFEKVSQNGSHVKMRNEDTGITVIVPYLSGTPALFKSTKLPLPYSSWFNFPASSSI